MTEAGHVEEWGVEALALWGGDARPRLVKWRENVVFDATLPDGRRVALRLHRPGYQTRSAIEAELAWTALLAAAGAPVPEPVPARSGSLTGFAGGRIASAVTWLAGAPIGSAEAPLPGSVKEQCDTMRKVGMLIATVHSKTDALNLPADFARPRWDKEGFLGPEPVWGRFWDNPAFDDQARVVIDKARVLARAELTKLANPGTDFGLIHADCLRENVLTDGERLSLIDFDDAGWGFRMYDLATSVFQALEEPAMPDLAEAVIEGYGSARDLPPDPEWQLTLFLMLRSFASAGWITTRAAPDDPRLPFYAARAVRLANAVLSGRTLWS